MESPITFLQSNSSKNDGQLQEPFIQRDGLLVEERTSNHIDEGK